MIDPGLGFGKRKEDNSVILARLGQLNGLELPIMVGPSRKSFLAHPDPEETRFASAGAVTAASWAVPTSSASTTCAKCVRQRT